MRAKIVSNRVFYFLLAGFTIFCAIHTTHHDLDFHVYYKAGLQVLAGNPDFYNIARDGGWAYRYGPSFPYVMAPFSMLSLPTAQAVWGILSALAFAGAWFLSESFLARRFGEGVRAPSVRLLTLLMLIDPVLRNADQGNVNAFAFLTMAAAVVLSDRRQDVWAALIIGFGAMMKVYPGAIIIYFLCARKWRAFMLSTLATFVWTFALPAIVYGPREMVRQILAWIAVLKDTGHYDYLGYINQAPNAIFWRIFGDPHTAKVLSVLLLLAVLAIYTVWVKRHREPMILFGAFALPFFILTCVFIEYFIVMMPLVMCANFLFLNRYVTRGEAVFYGLRIITVHVAVLAIIGRTMAQSMAFYGNCLWGLIVLLALLSLALPRLSSPSRADARGANGAC